MLTDLEKGYRVPGAVVNIAVVGAANATVIYTRSAFAQQIGTKTFVPRKLMVRNNAGGNLWLSLGTGVGGAFANALPPVRVMNTLDAEWQEFDLPEVDFFANMTAFPDALVAGGSIDVQVEVEEKG